MSKFKKVKIADLTEEECRELLGNIQTIVSELPSFIEIDRDGGYGRIADPYSCCSGYTNEGHSSDCGIHKLNTIFGLG